MIDSILNIDILGYILALVMLAITSYMDIRTREIDPILWIPFISIGVVIAGVKIYFQELNPLYLALNMFAPLMLAILAIQGLIGFADFFAITAVSLLITESIFNNSLIPPSIMILMITNLIIVTGSILPSIIINIKHFSYIKKICGSRARSILIIATSRIMTIEKYLSKKYYFPLIYPKSSNNYVNDNSRVWECRTSFLIDEDPEEFKKKIKILIDRKVINSDSLIAVAWGIPYILFIFIAVILYPIVAEYIEEALRAALSYIFNPS